MRTITNVMLDLDTKDKRELRQAGVYAFEINGVYFLKISSSVTITANNKSTIFEYIHKLEKAMWEIEEDL